jgi:phage tail tape-measure protein
MAGKSNTPGRPNLDPISGAPGAHPIGTGLGAAAGGMTVGAAMGAVVGPIGTTIGAALGAVVGGLAGKDIAETIDPTAEAAYWRANHSSRPYAAGTTYEEYAPAYDHAANSYKTYGGKSFDEVEGALGRDWDKTRSRSSMTWEKAKVAAREGWDHLTGSSPPMI